MLQKPGRNYAPNKPVTIAELSSTAAASEVDYERERLNLRKKQEQDAAKNNQSRDVLGLWSGLQILSFIV